MRKPILIVIAGPNGSGKTSITERVLIHEWVEQSIYVNPDNIAKEKFGNWNDRTAVIAAANFSQQLREDCLRDMKSLIFETVLSAVDKIDFIQRAKDKGYFIRIFFVGTNSPAINAKRIAQRVMEGGHDVPITKIISRYSKSIANCIICSSIADRVYVYDNSTEDEFPILLFRIVDKKVAKKYSTVTKWAVPILNSFLD